MLVTKYCGLELLAQNSFLLDVVRRQVISVVYLTLKTEPPTYINIICKCFGISGRN